MYTTGDSIHFVSFVISGFTTDMKKIYFVVSCILHRSFFFDKLSSDNTACSSSSASKTECTNKK